MSEGATREEVGKEIKRIFGVKFIHSGKYTPHQGFKEKERRLRKQGKTPDEISDILFGKEIEECQLELPVKES